MEIKGNNCFKWVLCVCCCVFVITIIVALSVLLMIESKNPQDPTLPRLSTPPRVKNVASSTIKIEWKGAYDGDGPVCGFIVELMPPASTSWTNVGFVSFDEVEDDFEYTIERLNACALYGISVILLHCSGREGERGPELSQSTEDHALPRLSTLPQVNNVATSTIEIEWNGAYTGEGPVCGFIVELRLPASTSWTSVGFVSFDEDEDDFEYTIKRLDANALYGISVIILHCSGRGGERSPEISQSTANHALPRLSTQPQVKNVATSTIEIEWKGDYTGDGPVCGFVIELKPPALTSWTSVGFVSFDENENDFEYTIERLDASAIYGISVIILHCSGREGKRGPEISQSTEDYESQIEPLWQDQNWIECPPNSPKDDLPWRIMFLIAVPVLVLIILRSCYVDRCRGNLIPSILFIAMVHGVSDRRGRRGGGAHEQYRSLQGHPTEDEGGGLGPFSKSTLLN